MSGLVSVLANLARIGLAWLIARADLSARRTMEAFVVAPLFLSPVLGALAWLILASPKAGLVNVFARDLLGVQAMLVDVATPTGIVLISSLYFVPYAYLYRIGDTAMLQIDRSIEEASTLSQASRTRRAGSWSFPTAPEWSGTRG